MSRAYRVSLFCGAVPLAVGVSIFLLWLVTRWMWLVYAGIITLYASLAVLAIGILTLLWFCWLAFRAPDMPRGRLWRPILLSAALLFSNFPVGIGVIAAFIAVETCYTVVVYNESPQTLGGVRILGGGCDISFGDVAPGSSTQRSFWVQNDGELDFRATIGGKRRREIIDGYVTGNMGGRTTVTVTSDEAISVSTER